VSQLTGRILVFDSHELFTEVPELSGRKIKRLLWHWVQRYWIPKASLCYSVGPKLALRLSLTYSAEFLSVRNVPNRKSIEVEHLPHVMLYQGTLNIGRGLEEAILALKELPEWQLWIAGSGPLDYELKQLSTDCGVKDRVKFYGNISPALLHDLTCRSSVGLNLLKQDSLNYYYSLANKFFDYVQAEIPSVNMNFPEYRDLCEEFNVAVLLDQCTSEDLIAAISTLSDEKKYTQLRSECKKAAQIWNWENEEKKIAKAYNRLFAEG
jgi:glycosyltransferase involved in cell wall biosynthesis